MNQAGDTTYTRLPNSIINPFSVGTDKSRISNIVLRSGNRQNAIIAGGALICCCGVILLRMLTRGFSTDLQLLYQWNSDIYWSNSGENHKKLPNIERKLGAHFLRESTMAGVKKNFDVYFGNSYWEANFDGFEHEHVKTNNTLSIMHLNYKGMKICPQTVKSAVETCFGPSSVRCLRRDRYDV